MTNVIQINGLTRLYAARQGIRDLTFSVGGGEIFGYLGPNGSGKTTTIRLMLGFIRADKGSLKLFGKKVTAGSTADRRRIGYVPGEVAFPEGATGRNLLSFYGKLSGSKCPRRDALCDALHLSQRDLRKPVRSLSRGTKQKLALVQAMQHDPDLLILDEPTTGLDPLSQEALFNLLYDYRDQGRTIFFSSHVLSEVQRLCDRVAVLREGSLVLQSTMMEMAAHADKLLWLKLSNTGEKLDRDKVPTLTGARFIRNDSGGWLLYLVRAGQGTELLSDLSRLNPVDFRLESALEESFLELYGVNVNRAAGGGEK